MAAPIPLRSDYDGPALRRFAKASVDANQTRRLLALSVIYDGGRRGAPHRDLADPFPLRIEARDREPHARGLAPRRHHSPDRRDWSARCRKAIAPNRESPVPGSASCSARRTRSISATRSYRVRCCSSDSASRGSSRRGPPASSCNAQACDRCEKRSNRAKQATDPVSLQKMRECQEHDPHRTLTSIAS